MSWIKLRKGLRDEPEVFQMAAELGLDRDTVVGKLARFWGWVDEHMESDNSTIGMLQIDALVEHPQFGVALKNAKWVVMTGRGIRIPNFDRHLSQGAKRRALTAERMRRMRERGDAASVIIASPDEMREDEMKMNPSSPLSGDEESSTSDSDEEKPETTATADHIQAKNGVVTGSEKDSDRENLRLHMCLWNDRIAKRLHAPLLRFLDRSSRIPERRFRNLRQRLKEHPDLWAEIEAEIPLVGEWAIDAKFLTFDWLTKSPINLTKFLEGNYRPKDKRYAKTEVPRPTPKPDNQPDFWPDPEPDGA